MSDFISIEVDKKSAEAVKKSISQYGKKAVNAVIQGVRRTAFAIESDAKRRLKGELGSAKHWITGRLAASVHTEMDGINSFESIKDSKSEDSNLGISVDKMESIVGTNVEYAQKIEFEYDSFLRFAGEKQSKKFSKRVEEEINKIR